MPLSVLIEWLVYWSVNGRKRFAMQSVRTMFYFSSSSDANARRSSAEVKVVISQPSFSFEEGGL
jgi:hypothetical protein